MKLLTKSKDVATVEDLLRDACALELAVRQRTDRRFGKLTRDGFVRAALATAKASPERIATLRKQLEAEASIFPRTWAFIRQLVIGYSQPTTTRPPRDASNAFLTVSGRDEAAAELATIAASALDASALAAALAGEDRHAVWGSVEDWEQYERQVRELQGRREHVLRRLDREAASHVTFDYEGTPDAIRSQGYIRASVSVGGVSVPLGPNLGERLVQGVLGSPAALKALGVKV